ncbi:MAG: hypothetical protein IK114_01965 [Fibrobacter sp.]|nr:hypothetical protein [Fibrobacter sp.]
MNQKSFMLKLVSIPLIALTASCFTACGDNPIEAENKKQAELSIDVDSALDTLASRRENTDYYSCYDKTKRFVDNYKKRCDNFIDRYRSSSADSVLSLSTVIRMVKDEDGYNDKGSFVGESNDPTISYLQVSKMLSITLTSYKQTADSISKSKKIGDPEIRFLVKSYIDSEPSEYDPLSATALDTLDVKKWSGEKKVAIQIPRGIDAIKICPVLRDKNEHDAYYDDEDLLKDSDCVSVKNLGWVEENKVKSQTTKGDKATISWEWFLYPIE